MLDINDIEQLNITFCNLVGIKPIRGMLLNRDTGEVKLYSTTNCLYRKPKGWEKAEAYTFDQPQFPNFTDKHNGPLLMEIQWELFGGIGEQYTRIKDESLYTNFLYTKINALQLIQTYGGSEMMTEFCKRVRESNYEYTLVNEVLTNG